MNLENRVNADVYRMQFADLLRSAAMRFCCAVCRRWPILEFGSLAGRLGNKLRVPLGDIFLPKNVVLIIAVSTRYESALAWAQQTLSAEYGELFLASKPFVFDQTTYYADSMGEDLKKQLVAHSALVDPAILPDVKRRTNEMEELYREQNDHPEIRPLNLDPGYISEGKLVLASTKNHSHRIYLRDGIFAEITLHYHKKAWQAREWTYPDYKQRCFHDFFDECRRYLRETVNRG